LMMLGKTGGPTRGDKKLGAGIGPTRGMGRPAGESGPMMLGIYRPGTDGSRNPGRLSGLGAVLGELVCVLPALMLVPDPSPFWLLRSSWPPASLPGAASVTAAGAAPISRLPAITQALAAKRSDDRCTTFLTAPAMSVSVRLVDRIGAQ
jgi:hypothetical protein